MFSSIGNFLHRHKRKFIVTGVVVGGAYLMVEYGKKKLREYQEREARKFLEMARKKQHYESNTRTFSQTVLSFLKIVKNTVLEKLNTEEILKKLQSDASNKQELWDQLKIMIFTKVCVMAYALSILHAIAMVQSNIIGGLLYRDTVYVKNEDEKIDRRIRDQYLSLCNHFVTNGIEELITQVEKAVKKVVEPVSLKKKVSLQEVEQLFWSIQTVLCSDPANIDPVKQMGKYLTDSTEFSGARLNSIVKETVNILECDEVVSLTTVSVGRAFSSVMDIVAGIFVTPQPTNKNHLESNRGDEHIVTNGAVKLGSSPFVNVNKVDLYFIKFIPELNKVLTGNGQSNIPDKLIQQLMFNEKAKVFGANVYEAFSRAPTS